ncbi:uncharacterized protein HMPREF1541_06056, partial [Cyphellophora europaea CBS 101466]
FFLRDVLQDSSGKGTVRILRPLMPHVEKGAKIVLRDMILPSTGDPAHSLDEFVIFMNLLMWIIFDAKQR